MITIKEIAPYLPYNLKCSVKSELYPNPTLIGIIKIYAYLNYYGTCVSFEIEKIKPILHPLSDLTKEIEVNGEKFVPVDKLEIDSCSVSINNVTMMPEIFLDECCLN